MSIEEKHPALYDKFPFVEALVIDAIIEAYEVDHALATEQPVGWLQTLDRTTRCLEMVLEGRPVRDADEVLSEARLLIMDTLMGAPKRESVGRDELIRLMADTECLTAYDLLDALESHGYKVIWQRLGERLKPSATGQARQPDTAEAQQFESVTAAALRKEGTP